MKNIKCHFERWAKRRGLDLTESKYSAYADRVTWLAHEAFNEAVTRLRIEKDARAEALEDAKQSLRARDLVLAKLQKRVKELETALLLAEQDESSRV